MKLLKIVFLLTLFMNFNGFSQEEDVYVKLIKRSSIAINKAQKEMRRTQKNDMGGLLAKAVILQNNALILYKANNNTRAACASALAKKYASLIIENLNQKEAHSYVISADEKVLITHCASDTELYNESKAAVGNASEEDKDYIKNFNNLKVNFN